LNKKEEGFIKYREITLQVIVISASKSISNSTTSTFPFEHALNMGVSPSYNK
jgi:hypothetical protein